MGKRIGERIKYWAQILLLPVYGLSFLFPRNRKIWLFGSTFGRRFADNPRYLFLYAEHNKSRNMQAVWISHRKDIVILLREHGHKAYYSSSLQGIFYKLRAGVYIFDNYSKDISFWLSGGAIKINLWHGSGNKKTNYDNMFDKVRHPKNNWEKWKTFLRRLTDEKPNHYTLATSEAMAEIFMSAFQTDKAHIIIAGYPRNDALFIENEEICKALLTEMEQTLLQELTRYKKDNYTFIAYIPTFRDSEEQFFNVMDLQIFHEFLKQRKLIFITKLHPKSKLKRQFEVIHYSNIINADAEIDVYTFLSKIDVLVTDYSSVYTDYMLLNRPVVAFQYDWDVYTANTRDSYIPHDEYMPEIKATTMQELMEAVDNVLREDKCLMQRLHSRDRMFDSTDGQTCERLFDKIMKLSGGRM